MKLDIVLFPKDSTDGIVASDVELVEETQTTVKYLATFDKPTELQGPPPAPVDDDGFEYEQQLVVPDQPADMRLTPEQVNAMGDTPNVDLPV